MVRQVRFVIRRARGAGSGEDAEGDDANEFEANGLHYAAVCQEGTTCPEDCLERLPFLGNASGSETLLEVPRCSPSAPSRYEIWILRRDETSGVMKVLARHGPIEAVPRSDEEQEAHRMKNWKKLGGGVQMSQLVGEVPSGLLSMMGKSGIRNLGTGTLGMG